MKRILSTGEWAAHQETYIESMERLSITSFVIAWISIIIGAAIILLVTGMWLLKVGL